MAIDLAHGHAQIACQTIRCDHRSPNNLKGTRHWVSDKVRLIAPELVGHLYEPLKYCADDHAAEARAALPLVNRWRSHSQVWPSKTTATEGTALSGGGTTQLRSLFAPRDVPDRAEYKGGQGRPSGREIVQTIHLHILLGPTFG